LTLAPEIADLLADRSPDTLLCAAGGIADGRGRAAALDARSRRRTRRLTAVGDDGGEGSSRSARRGARRRRRRTTLSRALDIARSLPWPDHHSCRVLRNRFSDTWDGREAELREAGPTVGEDWKRAFLAGDPDASNTVIGEAVGLIRDVQPAADVIERIIAEATTLLSAHSATTSACVAPRPTT
jgi:nitronate monooxygenase